MALTVAALRDLDVASLEAAAHRWRQEGARLQAAAGDVVTGAIGPMARSGWSGAAAELAIDRLRRHNDAIEVVATKALLVARALEHAADRLRAIRNRLHDLLEEAARHGLGVTDAGISLPPLDPAMRHEESYLAHREQLATAAGQHQPQQPGGHHRWPVRADKARPRVGATVIGRTLVAAVVIITTTLLAACASKENPSVATNGKSRQDTLNQVRALQEQVSRYGTELRLAVGGAEPNPTTVRIGPVPCPGRDSDLAGDGSFYVSGGWQINLDQRQQVATIRAVRDMWLAKGYRVVAYEEFDNATRAGLEGEDPSNGFAFSIISTTPPTAVGIRVLSTCVKPADGRFPGDSITIYQ